MKADFLTKIIETKKQEVEKARKVMPESRLVAKVRPSEDRRSFFAKLAVLGPPGANIIAEIKRASPSRGNIHLDLDAERQARSYERAGAAAISVLTDQAFFRARPDDLQKVRGPSTFLCSGKISSSCLIRFTKPQPWERMPS